MIQPSKLSLDLITISGNGSLVVNANTKVPFTRLLVRYGTRLTLENNGVKIGNGVSLVKVSSHIYCQGFNSYAWTIARKNGAEISGSKVINSITSNYGSVVMSPILVDVAGGDLIDLVSLDRIPEFKGNNSIMTVEVVK